MGLGVWVAVAVCGRAHVGLGWVGLGAGRQTTATACLWGGRCLRPGDLPASHCHCSANGWVGRASGTALGFRVPLDPECAWGMGCLLMCLA